VNTIDGLFFRED